jgi:peptidoglycan/xylan/chitin deacetylase (PgdA/CDA1 family)
MKKNKILISFLISVIVFLGISYSLFLISKSRTFQFFGEIIARVDTNEKVVALTFDDAPTEYTEPVLKTLQEKQIKATFFAIGSNLEKYPQSGKEIAQQGHELGNHSYSHQRMLLKSQSFINQEIQKTNNFIRQTGYNGEIYFRPPNSKKLFGLPWYLSQHGIKTITADVEPDTYGNTTDFFVTYTIENTKPGSIILLHPFCEGCNSQREAISKIVDGLQTKGYQFVTVSELLTYKNK